MTQGLLIIGEYRAGQARKIDWIDTGTGKSSSRKVIQHLIECSGEGQMPVAHLVTERLPDGADVDRIVLPNLKGKQVVAHITSIWTGKNGKTTLSVDRSPTEIQEN